VLAISQLVPFLTSTTASPRTATAALKFSPVCSRRVTYKSRYIIRLVQSTALRSRSIERAPSITFPHGLQSRAVSTHCSSDTRRRRQQGTVRTEPQPHIHNKTQEEAGGDGNQRILWRTEGRRNYVQIGQKDATRKEKKPTCRPRPPKVSKNTI
jgi:hypothetical protein